MAKIQYIPPRSAAKTMISSFEKNPDISGKPASASAPTIRVKQVNGIALRKPDIRSMFWFPAIAAMIDPAAMKRRALKKACVIRWKIPAVYAPIETATIM